MLGDLGRLGHRETPVVLSILVFEDLAMAVYLPILIAVLAGAPVPGGLSATAISLVVVTLVLVLALRFGRYVSAIVDSRSPEAFLLRVLGVALLVAGVAQQLQVSAAVGAFLLGIAISGSTAGNATRLLEPLRDLFAALFFVVFELNTIPSLLGTGHNGHEGRDRLVGGEMAGQSGGWAGRESGRRWWRAASSRSSSRGSRWRRARSTRGSRR